MNAYSLESNLDEMLTPQLIELGSIKIGTLGEERKKRSGSGSYRLPKKLDHFIVTTRFRDPDGLLTQDRNVMDALVKTYGDDDGKVRRIPITVLSDDIEDILRSNWVYYKGKQCFARSNGRTLLKYGDPKTGEIFESPETKEWDSNLENGKGFKKHTTLDCVIAVPDARWGGVYRFRTTSVISGDQLYGSLLHLKQLTGGVLVAMPLMLVVRPMQVAPDGQPTTVYVVHVELMGKDLHALQQQALASAQFRRENKDELARLKVELKEAFNDPGENEDAEVQSDVQQEFHPDEDEGEEPSENNTLRVFQVTMASAGYTIETLEEFCREKLNAEYSEVVESEVLMQEAMLKAKETNREE